MDVGWGSSRSFSRFLAPRCFASAGFTASQGIGTGEPRRPPQVYRGCLSTSIRGSALAAARSGSLTQMTKGSPPASSAKDKSYATAGNSIPATAGTPVPAMSAGAAAPAKTAGDTAPAMAGVSTAASFSPKTPRLHPEEVHGPCNFLAHSFQGHPRGHTLGVRHPFIT